MQLLNTYDDFDIGIEKTDNDKAILVLLLKETKERYSLNVPGKFWGKYFVSETVPTFFGLREDSERRLHIQHFHVSNEFVLDVVFCYQFGNF